MKWSLWYGNVTGALDTIEDVEGELALLSQDGESRKKLLSARISRLYRSEPKLYSEPWGSLKARREDFNGLRGVRSEESGEQAHGQEAADALDRVRRAESTSGPDQGAQ